MLSSVREIFVKLSLDGPDCPSTAASVLPLFSATLLRDSSTAGCTLRWRLTVEKILQYATMKTVHGITVCQTNTNQPVACIHSNQNNWC